MFELAYKNNSKLIILRHELHFGARREREGKNYTVRGNKKWQTLGCDIFLEGNVPDLLSTDTSVT